MERDYDLFEIDPDGSLVWQCVVNGHDAAIAKLRELAEKTKNEVRVIHVPTYSIVAVLNASGGPNVSDVEAIPEKLLAEAFSILEGDVTAWTAAARRCVDTAGITKTGEEELEFLLLAAVYHQKATYVRKQLAALRVARFTASWSDVLRAPSEEPQDSVA